MQINEEINNVIIMDEVDGMSSGDRGGNAELIQMIKKTKVIIQYLYLKYNNIILKIYIYVIKKN